MHGLINRAIECFVRDTYGDAFWQSVAMQAGLSFKRFEALLMYDARVTEDVMDALADQLGKSPEEVLEDIGTYLVSHPNVEALRRLLRFSGVDFVEFLHSLDDLPGRARLAVSDLELPELELREQSSGRFSLVCKSSQIGFGHVMVGVLRAMADDYGALVLLEHTGFAKDGETVDIKLLETEFAQGRDFSLGQVQKEESSVA